MLLVYGDMYYHVAKRKTLNLTGQYLSVVDSQAVDHYLATHVIGSVADCFERSPGGTRLYDHTVGTKFESGSGGNMTVVHYLAICDYKS